jgi:DtxR family Mn-dependent transcriptional regulator
MPEITYLPPGSSTQRGGLNHQAIEDYLKTIYMLAEDESPVSTSRIAAARNVKPASVTGMLQRLEQLQLVNYEKHYGVTLTETGHKIALEVIRHHRLIELYLIEALGFSWDEVHEQADILEHVISEKLEERIAAALGYPTLDPHGDPIPNKEGKIVQVNLRPLTTIAPTQTARVSRILQDDNSERLRYLAELGLTPGTAIELIAVEPKDGPITFRLHGEERVINHDAAAVVLVDLLENQPEG